MPELKPCPICSSLSVGLCPGEDEITHEIYNQAFCTSCGVSGPRVFADEISAIAAWNSPRALTWTTEPPKVAGWYWCRPSELNMPRCVEVYGAREQLMFGSKRDDFNPQVPVTKEGFEWAGPIPTPLEPEES